MNEEIRIYLHHIKTVCPELSEDKLLRFGEKLTVTVLDKNDVYITAGHIQKQGGFLVKGLLRAFHTDDLGNEKISISFLKMNMRFITLLLWTIYRVH